MQYKAVVNGEQMSWYNVHSRAWCTVDTADTMQGLHENIKEFLKVVNDCGGYYEDTVTVVIDVRSNYDD